MSKDPRTYIPSKEKRSAKRYTVDVPVAWLRRRNLARSPADTQLLYGTEFSVCKVSRGWAWGQEISPVKGSKEKGYVGYIRAKYLSDHILKPTHVIASLKAPVFMDADIKSPIVSLLHLGARIKGRVTSDFLETDLGYIHQKHLNSHVPDQMDFVSVAEAHRGLPYIWGGISSDGLDCSGLVQTSLRAVGKDAPRDSDMQAKIGTEITMKQGLKRGDLVFWKGHVGIMQSSSRMIHANAYHMKVESEAFDDAVKRIRAQVGPITSIRRLEA